MNNCIVTKLKFSVSGDLEKLGVLTINRKTTASHTADTSLLQSNSSVKFKIVGDGFFTRTVDGASIGTEYTSAQGGDIFYSSNGNYQIEVSPKYDVNIRQLGSGNELRLEDTYYTEITKIRGAGFRGNLAALNPEKIDELQIASSNITGTLDDIVRLTKITILYFPGLSGFGGDIAKMATLLSLITVKFGYAMTGTIESWVAAYRANGRTSGSITTQFLNEGNGSVTFNGTQITPTATNKVLSWDASTITFDGTTITA